MPSYRHPFLTLLFVLPLSLLCWSAESALAQDRELFEEGPVIKGVGDNAPVKPDFKLPADMKLKVRFDVVDAAKPGEVNKTFDRVARMINVHARQGVKAENLKIAVVVHGKAIWDVTSKDYYGVHQDGKKQGSVEALRKLHRHGVLLILCGQTAASYKVKKENLVPVIQIAPSAMTAHAVLAKQGYSLNPF